MAVKFPLRLRALPNGFKWLAVAVVLAASLAAVAEEVNRPKMKQPGVYYNRTTKAGVKIVVAYPADGDGCPANDQIKLWWRNYQWNAKSDAPYAQAKRDIDQAIKNGVTPLKLTEKYKTVASADLYDPLKTYRWAYAAWLARKKVKTKGESDAIFHPLYAHFSETPFPDSYHYARMGFFVNAYKAPIPCLKRLGDRLLQQNPNDEDVKFYMIRVLTGTQKSEDDERALSYLSYFRSKYPKNTYYVREQALRYNKIFDRAYPLEQKKANTAITALQSYIQVAPNTYEKTWATAIIADIKRQMSNWNLYGRKYWLKEQAQKQ